MAYSQVVEFGMSSKIGHVSLPMKGSQGYARTIYSDKLSKLIDEVSDYCANWINGKDIYRIFCRGGGEGGGGEMNSRVPPASVYIHP